jgi:hypothetical protein
MPADDPSGKELWTNLSTKIDAYFDDETSSTVCGKYSSRNQRRRKLFERPDQNLLCAIHHAVLHNNLFVVKKLVEEYSCGKHVDLLCLHRSIEPPYLSHIVCYKGENS